MTNVFSLLLYHLQHNQVTALVALTNHQLAHQRWVLGHQHVLELIELKKRQQENSTKSSCRVQSLVSNEVISVGLQQKGRKKRWIYYSKINCDNQKYKRGSRIPKRFGTTALGQRVKHGRLLPGILQYWTLVPCHV